MLNNVSLTGRLTKDPELRQSQNGLSIGNFTLAVNRTYKDNEGNTQADFINCVLFRKTAEVAKDYAFKGHLVGVTGRLQSRSYENKDGQRVFVTEVVVDNLALLETKNNQNQQNGNNQYQQPNNNYNRQQKNQYQQSNNQNDNPFNNNGGNVDINDDDLPF